MEKAFGPPPLRKRGLGFARGRKGRDGTASLAPWEWTLIYIVWVLVIGGKCKWGFSLEMAVCPEAAS